MPCSLHCVTLTMHHSVTLCLEQEFLFPYLRPSWFPKLSPCKVSLPPTLNHLSIQTWWDSPMSMSLLPLTLT